MWRVCKEANRPWPTLTDDDVLDYMVMEAVAIKARREEAEAQKEHERKAWRKERGESLEKMR